MTAALLSGLVAGYGVAIPVGAIAVLVIGLSARVSLRVGAAAALGVATADGLYAATATVGGLAVARLVTPVAGPLRWIAAVVLLGLAGYGGWRTLARHRAPVTGGRGEALASAVRAYPALLGLTLLNPMTIVYFVALVMGRPSLAGTGRTAAVFFVAGVFLASASWQLLLAAGGSLVGRTLAGRTGRLVTGLFSSALIATLAVTHLP